MKNIKNIFGISLISIFILLSACDKLFGDLMKFESDYTYFEFQILPQDEPGGYAFMQKVQESDLMDVLEDNGFDEDDIDEIKLKETIFEVVNEDQGVNFNGISSFGASFLDANSIETIVAEITSVPENSRQVSLSTKDKDITAFLVENYYTFIAFGEIDEAFTDTIEVSAKIKYEVKAKL